MTSLTVLPYSSASVERIFSQVNCTKNQVSNLLKAESVTDRVLVKQAINRKSKSRIYWEPKDELLNETVEGKCHKRYLNRIQQQKESK